MDLLSLSRELEYLQTHKVEMGILSIDKDKTNKSGATILEYAVYNEFGTDNIPARPLMRRAIKHNKDTIKKYIDERIKEVTMGHLTGKQAYIHIGNFVCGLIIKQIQGATHWAVPLKKSTMTAKLKKGANNFRILLDERALIAAIRYQITDENGTVEHLSEYYYRGG